MLQQKLLYLHENPVRVGLIYETLYYKYSSAVNHYTNIEGLSDLQPFVILMPDAPVPFCGSPAIMFDLSEPLEHLNQRGKAM